MAEVLHLVGCPHAGGLSHPLSGVDASVDPDGRTVLSSSAELNTTKRETYGLDFFNIKRNS